MARNNQVDNAGNRSGYLFVTLTYRPKVGLSFLARHGNQGMIKKKCTEMEKKP